jgi:hypothetical protein
MDAGSLSRFAFASIFATLLPLGAAVAQTYSVSSDFSTSNNPNGPWTYGWLNSLGGSFTAYSQIETISGSGGNVYGWIDPNHVTSFDPVDLYNPNATAMAFSTAILPAGAAAFHPGPNDEISDFRFTVPAAGNYAFNFTFEGADTHGTTTDVHIYTNGQNVYSADVNGFGASSAESFSGMLSLNSGQIVDIGVGFGTNGNYLNDTTMISGTISAVPEPSTWIVTAAGLALIGWRSRGSLSRRRYIACA